MSRVLCACSFSANPEALQQDLHPGLVIELAVLHDVIFASADHGGRLYRPIGAGGGGSDGALVDTSRSDAVLLALRPFARAIIIAGTDIREENSPMAHIWADDVDGAFDVHPVQGKFLGFESATTLYSGAKHAREAHKQFSSYSHP
jgi:hypothetical protein